MVKKSPGWHKCNLLILIATINFEDFHKDTQLVLQRALDNEVYRIVVPGLDLQTSREAVELAEKYDQIYAAVGVHPGSLDSFSEDHLVELSKLISHKKVVAVGEIGLDFFHHTDNKEQQRALLNKMFTLAEKHNKPVILHSREALPELIEAIHNWKNKVSGYNPRGIFHAFEGDYQSAQHVSNLGFLVGAGGPVTYKNASVKREVFSKIELGNIVLETDAPFLSPLPFRGTRNEPGNIPVIAIKLAELRQCSIAKIAEETTKNAKILFDWID